MQNILITGGTGLVGRRLTKMLLSAGYSVTILTRAPPAKAEPDPHLSYKLWDVTKQTVDIAALQAADFIIHLAGAGVVDKKWTEAYKKEIKESRTESSKLLVDTLKNHAHSVKAIVSSSAIGWYGADEREGFAFTETDPADEGFLGQTCKVWEESIEAAEGLGIRVVKLRTGIVLSNDGGALAEFKKPIQLGVAGILGDGKQTVSWIHLEDLCRMLLFAIQRDAVTGSYNAVAPNPVTNKELTLKLAKLMKGSFFVPMHVPVFVLKLMMGTRSIEVLKSTTVSATKLREAGFTFLYPSIDAALNELCGKQKMVTDL